MFFLQTFTMTLVQQKCCILLKKCFYSIHVSGDCSWHLAKQLESLCGIKVCMGADLIEREKAKDRQNDTVSISHVVSALAPKVNFSYLLTTTAPLPLPPSPPSLSISICLLCSRQSVYSDIFEHFSLKSPPAKRKCFVSAELHALFETDDRIQGARLHPTRQCWKSLENVESTSLYLSLQYVTKRCCIFSSVPSDTVKLEAMMEYLFSPSKHGLYSIQVELQMNKTHKKSFGI